tara:strand:+ start:311 stop:805 length:495 start_codon:yes stop_codon:yes gene_type:complete
MKKDNIFIFDLDGTTINSSHRQGHGSLVSWFRNNVPENIIKDTPMYLGQFIGILFNLGFKVLICTSRTLSKADYEFLYTKLYIPVDVKIISREKGDKREPEVFKKWELSYLANFKQFKDCEKILIDDNPEVRRTFRELGKNCKAWDIPFAIERFNHIFGWSKSE